MRTTLEDFEFKKAIEEVDKLLENIDCPQECKWPVYEKISTAKEIVYTVLEAIGINY
jgi:hypothetical protein